MCVIHIKHTRKLFSFSSLFLVFIHIYLLNEISQSNQQTTFDKVFAQPSMKQRACTNAKIKNRKISERFSCNVRNHWHTQILCSTSNTNERGYNVLSISDGMLQPKAVHPSMKRFGRVHRKFELNFQRHSIRTRVITLKYSRNIGESAKF